MARQQTQLVTQHLENTSRKALEKYEEIVRQYVRRRHGVVSLGSRKSQWRASRLRGREAPAVWIGWGILPYNLGRLVALNSTVG